MKKNEAWEDEIHLIFFTWPRLSLSRSSGPFQQKSWHFQNPIKYYIL